MVSILHLSDLHLLPTDGFDAGKYEWSGQILGDYKSDVIAPENRQTRHKLISSSLFEIGKAFSEQEGSFDAVVVSGDVTSVGRPDGLQMLEETLSRLGNALPSPDRIMVVPGNHDVRWHTPAGSAERYSDFVEHIRALGYVTSYLEGVDITPDGVLAKASVPPTIVGTDESYILVALNSANFCGLDSPPELSLAPHLDELRSMAKTSDAVRLLLKAWESRGLFDVARIDSHQRQYASLALRDARASLRERAAPPTIVAVMHHPLVPVGLEEELKPFDALTNLAEVRDWIAANNVDILMHGHKHVGKIAQEQFAPEQGDTTTSARLLILSTGTVGLGRNHPNEIAKVVEFKEELPTLRRVAITSIDGVSGGIPISLDRARRREFRIGREQSQRMLLGKTVREVHEQLLALTAESSKCDGPIVCEITSSAGAGEIPVSYPQDSLISEEDAQAWFAEMVELWQDEHRLAAMPFNHGERILNLGGVNQLDNAIAALRTNPSSSRAVLTLLKPSHDTVGVGTEFPAFCLVQLVVTDGQLDVIGYFRKQEMRYWWPINVAELASMQAQVLSALSLEHLTPGRLVTITAIPTSGRAVPRVSVPLIDRWADREPARIQRMALLLHNPTLPDGPSILNDWHTLVRECEPPSQDAADGDPIPTVGLAALEEHLRRLTFAFEPESTTSSPLFSAVQALNSLHGQLRAEPAAASASAVRRNEHVDALRSAVEHMSVSVAQHASGEAPNVDGVGHNGA